MVVYRLTQMSHSSREAGGAGRTVVLIVAVLWAVGMGTASWLGWIDPRLRHEVLAAVIFLLAGIPFAISIVGVRGIMGKGFRGERKF